MPQNQLVINTSLWASFITEKNSESKWFNIQQPPNILASWHFALSWSKMIEAGSSHMPIRIHNTGRNFLLKKKILKIRKMGTAKVRNPNHNRTCFSTCFRGITLYEYNNNSREEAFLFFFFFNFFEGGGREEGVTLSIQLRFACAHKAPSSKRFRSTHAQKIIIYPI